MGIPELDTAPELYYNEKEAAKYSQSTRIIHAQQAMTERCLELSGKETGFALDVGCGTGISGGVLEENGFVWVGVDVSYHMLKLCRGGCVHADVGEGIPFRPGTFDLIVSVSCVQWLFYSYRSSHVPLRRIRRFFSGLFVVLREDGVCVIQFYCNKKQTEILKREAVHAGFDGNLVVDSPNTRNEKQFLVMRCGHVRRETENRGFTKRKHRRERSCVRTRMARLPR